MAYTDDVLNKYANPAIDYAKSFSADRAGVNAKQYGEEQDYLSRYRKALGGQESLPDMYKRLGIELGIPNLQQSSNTLNTTLANIPATYSSATRGFDVNANQLSRTIGQKTAELQPVVTSTNNALTSAVENAGRGMQYGIAQQQKELLPFQTEASMLSDRWAREQTGFTTDHQAELSALISKMQSGVQLSEGEANRANALAVAEKQYETQLKIAQMNIESSKYGIDKKYETDRQANLIALANKF